MPKVSRILFARTTSGLTLEQFAILIGRNKRTIYYYERGYSNVSDGMARHLAFLFGGDAADYKGKNPQIEITQEEYDKYFVRDSNQAISPDRPITPAIRKKIKVNKNTPANIFLLRPVRKVRKNEALYKEKRQ